MAVLALVVMSVIILSNNSLSWAINGNPAHAKTSELLALRVDAAEIARLIGLAG